MYQLELLSIVHFFSVTEIEPYNAFYFKALPLDILVPAYVSKSKERLEVFNHG